MSLYLTHFWNLNNEQYFEHILLFSLCMSAFLSQVVKDCMRMTLSLAVEQTSVYTSALCLRNRKHISVYQSLGREIEIVLDK